jgi:hypothetical protein
MRRETVKRLAALEGRLLPPPRIIWSPWQRWLNDEQYALVGRLIDRGARHGGDGDARTWFDDWATWAGLCQDAREIELLGQIKAVAEANEGEELHLHMLDLRL